MRRHGRGQKLGALKSALANLAASDPRFESQTLRDWKKALQEGVSPAPGIGLEDGSWFRFEANDLSITPKWGQGWHGVEARWTEILLDARVTPELELRA